jgi:sugar fermentation stimulation protein A
MELPGPLIAGRLERRYRRFLADVVLEDGTRTTVHCPNTGAMYGCDRPGSRVWLSRSDNPRRKYPLTWELVESDGGALVGIHSARANRLVREALEAGALAGLDVPLAVRAERTVAAVEGRPPVRVDFAVRFPGDERDCLIEVKSVTAVDEGTRAFFPDAVSARAERHLNALATLARTGLRCMLIYCVQRADVDRLRAASEIDPAYARALLAAREAGVETRAWRWRVTPERILPEGPVALDPVVV